MRNAYPASTSWSAAGSQAGPDRSPYDAYTQACRLAQVGKLTDSVARLRFAVTRPKWVTAARRDPALKPLRRDSAFQKLVAAARTDFWELDVFALHRSTLQAVGVNRPTRLHTLPVSEADLVRYLAVDALVARRLLRVAALALRTDRVLDAAVGSWQGLRPYRVELVAALVAEGVETPSAAACVPARDVVRRVQERCLVNLSEDEVAEWLREL